MFDFFRVSAIVPEMRVGDAQFNTVKICAAIEESLKDGSSVCVFPELSVTGATCGDLFFQSKLQAAVGSSIEKIIEVATKFGIIAVVGAPLVIDDKLYNCAVVISDGKVNGIIAKTNVQNSRWFKSNNDIDCDEIDSYSIGLYSSDNYKIPVGNSIFNINGKFKFGVEIGEDINLPISPSTVATINGAEIIFNLSAARETVNARLNREELVKNFSKSNICAYCLVSAGADESTSDFVMSGHLIIAENGKVIAQNDNVCVSQNKLCADIDLGKIKSDKIKFGNFNTIPASVLVDAIKINNIKSNKLDDTCGEKQIISKFPFVPEDENIRILRCNDIFDIQVEGLKKRAKVTDGKLVVGISGGLDSTLALLVSVECMKRLGKPLTDVVGITMPCFGTSGRTYNNSLELMKKLGVTTEIIDIKNACLQHFKDIGHDTDTFDVTYENTQARERTQILMDYAGKIGGFVVGTGDLSELALGWCTYNGDHMSMYSVNCGVPKTLIRWIIDSLIVKGKFTECESVLRDILDTPISPELLPANKKGEISQVTEDIVGPYCLHDFFLYYAVRYGFEPKKIYHLAKIAFNDEFDNETLKKWLKNFYKRFFNQQFKRNCVPDGVKIGSVGLSPRGDWSMPSDAVNNLWINSINEL